MPVVAGRARSSPTTIAVITGPTPRSSGSVVGAALTAALICFLMAARRLVDRDEIGDLVGDQGLAQLADLVSRANRSEHRRGPGGTSIHAWPHRESGSAARGGPGSQPGSAARRVPCAVRRATATRWRGHRRGPAQGRESSTPLTRPRGHRPRRSYGPRSRRTHAPGKTSGSARRARPRRRRPVLGGAGVGVPGEDLPLIAGRTRLAEQGNLAHHPDERQLRAQLPHWDELRDGRVNLGIEVDGRLIGEIQTFLPADRTVGSGSAVARSAFRSTRSRIAGEGLGSRPCACL